MGDVTLWLNGGMADGDGERRNELGNLGRISGLITRSLQYREAEELKEIRQRSFGDETRLKLDELRKKRTDQGLIGAGRLRYEDIAAVVHGAGELLVYDTQHVETRIHSLGRGEVSEEAFESGGVREFFVKRLKVGVGTNDLARRAGDPVGYGFNFWMSGSNSPLDEQLVFEVARKFYEAGVPLVGKAASLMEELKSKK